jgi:Tol biopolymer transport system component
MKWDGTQITSLRDPKKNAQVPRWHPSGAQIFFINNDLDSKNSQRGIWRISSDGGSRTSVFLSDGIKSIDISPDGSKLLAYVRAGHFADCLGTEFGSANNPTLTGHLEDGQKPWDSCLVTWNINTNDWSLSNQQIIQSQSPDVYFVNAVWSPDGTKIAAISDGVMIMNADGSNPKEITPASWKKETSEKYHIDWR